MNEPDGYDESLEALRAETLKRERSSIVKSELIRVLESLSILSDRRLLKYKEAELRGWSELELSLKMAELSENRKKLNAELMQLLDENSELNR